ncbi:helix-turn-helix domain-containing protein [Candidatus Nitrotoga sp. M5]|uniref:helix-turn-helix domain-containing protein n=1 Tax=Candidatus Nitrotoga sp. M5 TaxID=2890409 RepID=UPI001EF22823|nr:hypothetical protein [Candidatus Nitrotoga sp. M5]CAH1385147.1 hypothetical protein NTGM5_10029 [Candidatus Nitrotoga sp. M5]
MSAIRTQFDIQAIQTSWQAFDALAHLRPIPDKKSYDRMVALMNSLLDTTGDDENHPLSGLLDLVGDMVSKYEQEHYAIEAAEPKDAVRFFMAARGLKSARRWRMCSHFHLMLGFASSAPTYVSPGYACLIRKVEMVR